MSFKIPGTTSKDVLSDAKAITTESKSSGGSPLVSKDFCEKPLPSIYPEPSHVSASLWELYQYRHYLDKTLSNDTLMPLDRISCKTERGTGISAYQQAIIDGFKGSETEWIQSIVYTYVDGNIGDFIGSELTELKEYVDLNVDRLDTISINLDNQITDARNLVDLYGVRLGAYDQELNQYSFITNLQYQDAEQILRIESLEAVSDGYGSRIDTIENVTSQQATLITSLKTTAENQGSQISTLLQTSAEHATYFISLGTYNEETGEFSKIRNLELTTSEQALQISHLETESENASSSIVSINQTLDNQATVIENLETKTDNTESEIISLRQTSDNQAVQINHLSVRSTNTENDVSELTNRVTTNESSISNIQHVTDEQATSIQSLETRSTEIETDLYDLDTRVVTSESNITSLQQTTSEQATSLSNLSTRTETIETDLNGVESRVTSSESNINNLQQTTSDQATQINELNTKTTNIENNVSGLENELFDVDLRITTSESNITNLQQTTADQATSITNLTTRTDTLETDVNGIETRTTTAESNITNLQTTTSSQATSITNLNTKTTELEDNLSTLSSDVTGIESRVTTSESDITTIQQTTSEQAISLTNLTTRTDTLETDLNGIETRVTGSESNITTLQQTTSLQATQINELNTKTTTIENNLADLDSDVSNVETRITTSESNISNLQQTTSNQATQINDLVTRTEEVETSLDGIDIRATTSESNINNLQQTTDSQATAITSLNTKTSTLENDLASLEGEVSGIDSRLTTSESTIESIQQTSSEQAIAVTNLTTRTETLETDFNGLESRVGVSESNITNLQSTTADQATSLSQLSTRADSLETGLIDLGNEVGLLDGEVSGIESRLTTSESNINNLEQTTSNQATAISDLNTRTGIVESDVSGLVTRVTDSESNISTLQQTTSTQATQINSLSTRVSITENDINGLENRTSSTESNITNLQTTTANQATSITNLGTRITTVENDVDSIDGRVSTNESNITNVQQTTATQATQISTLVTRTDNNESEISTLQTTTSDQALLITGLTTRADDSDSAISTLQTTTAGQATQLSNLTTTVGNNTSNITNLSQTVDGQATTLTNLSSRVGVAEDDIDSLGISLLAAESNISNLQTVTSDHALWFTALGTYDPAQNKFSTITSLQTTTASQATSITNLTTRVGSAESNISTLNTTTSNHASQLTNISSTLYDPDTGLAARTAAVELKASTNTSDIEDIQAEYTMKVTADGKTAGIGLIAGSTSGTRIYLAADRIAFLNSFNDNVSTAGLNIPFIVEDGVTYIDDARIRRLSASRITGGNAVIDSLTVVDEITTPYGWIRDVHLDSEFVRTIVRRDPNAVTTGGTANASRAFSAGAGNVNMGSYPSAGTSNQVSVAVNGVSTFFGGSAPSAPQIQIRVRETGTNQLVSLNGQTTRTFTGTVTDLTGGEPGMAPEWEVRLHGSATGTFTPAAGTTPSYRLEVVSYTGTIINGVTTADASEAVSSSDGITVYTNWAEIDEKPFTTVGTGLSTSGDSLSVVYGTTAGTAAAGNHTHAASAITSGTFSVARGGTGLSTLTSGSVLVGNGTSAVQLVSRSGIDTRATFPPATHTHTLADITDSGNVAAINTNGVTTQYLRGDGTWQTPPNTTYSEITELEIDNGTASTLRTITGRRMGYALAKKADVNHGHSFTQVTGGTLNFTGNVTGTMFFDGATEYNIPLTIQTVPTTTLSGIVPNTNLPDSAKRSEISTANITNTTSSSLGFISGRRMNDALTNYGDPFNSSGTYSGLRAQATTKADVGLSGIPNTNGSTANYLRGDGSWVTPPNTTYSAGSGISLSGTTFSVAGGDGLTQQASGLAVDASVVRTSGNQTLTGIKSFERPLQLFGTSGTLYSNLGSPSLTEMALFGAQFDNKLQFYPPGNIEFEQSTNGGVSWTPVTNISDTVKKRFVSGRNMTAFSIPRTADKYRIIIHNRGSYVYLNALYLYASTSGNSMRIQILKKRNEHSDWTTHTALSPYRSSWPGHFFLPFSTIPFSQNSTASHFHSVCIEIEPNWSHESNTITLYNMDIWGGYPAGKREIYSWDEDQNVQFPAEVSASAFTGNIFGNATTATTLQTARTINGTSFNGSANITTANWGTARTLTIGNAGKSVNGSGNVSWSLVEIGAAASSHTHNASDITAGVFDYARLPISSSDVSNWNNKIDSRSGVFSSVSGLVDSRALFANVITTASTAVGFEYNILLNAQKKGITVTQSGTGTISNPYSLFNGRLSPNYSSDGVNPADPFILNISGLPATHTQTGALFGWTCRYWVPTRFKVEAFNNSTGQWVTWIDRSDEISAEAAKDLVIPMSGGVGSGAFTDIRITIYDSNGSIGSNGFRRWGISEIFFIHPEASRTYENARAGWADELFTARTINGTSFNGSANITTANWGTARTLTVGNTGKSVNGSGNVSWSLAEIGAAASSLTLTGGDGINTIGDLTANRTISVDGTVARTYSLGNFNNIIDTVEPWGKAVIILCPFTGSNINNVLGSIYSQRTSRNRDVGRVDFGYSCNTTTPPTPDMYLEEVWGTQGKRNEWKLVTFDYQGTTWVGLYFDGARYSISNAWFQGVTNYSGAEFLTVLSTSQITNLSEFSVTGAEKRFSATVVAQAFSGNGSGLTNLNASNLSSGTLAVARLPSTAYHTTNLPITGMSWNSGSKTLTLNRNGVNDISQAMAHSHDATDLPNTVVYTVGDQTIGGTKTFSSVIAGSINGNAGTATTLQTARTINGTSFNGSANITTSSWGTARTLTIGSTGKSVNGSGNVSWSLAEIGAADRTLTLTAGDGLSGGGNLTADRTISVDASVVRTSGDQSIAGVKTFTTRLHVTGTSKAAGAFYAGTVNPTNTTRLNYDGVLWTNDTAAVSSRRYKNVEYVVSPQQAADNVRKLGSKGVSVGHYKADKDKTGKRWLIAEDVAQVMKEPVYFDGQGRPDGLSNDQLIPELYAALAHALKRIDELEARLANNGY